MGKLLDSGLSEANSVQLSSSKKVVWEEPGLNFEDEGEESEEEGLYHYETVELTEMEYQPEIDLFRYNCPCGDWFQITSSEILRGDRVAHCPSCSLTIFVRPGLNVEEYVQSLRSV